ncbi:potassium channel family protein [Thermococcus sp. MV11]|uniref:potassium channel family protein n=1 Tax=Thermococcus sp. MV11 TaxID=1638267 RepID=UPI00142F9555|nr:potassium channel family protein [Thermococcus sp. MV11]NJE04355.1 hypothetical protein [Thermococcus sp. MV11]
MCKMAHFGNCDPETADQEYCIFHKPNKSEEEEAVEFYRKFLERFKPRIEEIEVKRQKVKRLVFEEPVDARGFVFPEVPDVTIEHEFTTKEGKALTVELPLREAIFKWAVFKSTVYFNAAKFEGSIRFDNSVFYGETSFSEAIFTDCSFMEVKFKKTVWFNSSISIGKSYPLELGNKQYSYSALNFFKAEFFEDVFFQKANFCLTVHFGETKFYKTADFYNVTFCFKTSFHMCEFRSTANFQNSLFLPSSFQKRWPLMISLKSPYHYNVSYIFARSTFKDVAAFDFAEFGECIFNFATFEKGASFKSAKFYDEARFEEVLFEDTVEFQDAVFKGDALFTNSTFERLAIFTGKPDDEKYKFEGKLSFEYCDIYKGIQIDLPREWFKLSEAFIEAMRIQKLSYERLGRYEDADRVLVSLKREQRKAKNIVIRFFEWLLLDWSSEYLTNPKKILRTSGVVIIVFGLIYWIAGCVDFCILRQLSITNCLEFSSGPICSGGIKYGCTGNFVGDLLNSLYFSTVTFTTLGFGDLAPTGLMKAFAATEALLGAILMAALVSVGVQKITM